jgi:hypothetical protein
VSGARIDHVIGGIYRISVWSPDAGLTFNQFLIDDDAPTLVHTGRYDDYDAVVAAVSQVLDPARLAHLVLLHWEGDENGGMDRFMSRAPGSQLVGSALSISLNAAGFGLHARTALCPVFRACIPPIPIRGPAFLAPRVADAIHQRTLLTAVSDGRSVGSRSQSPNEGTLIGRGGRPSGWSSSTCPVMLRSELAMRAAAWLTAWLSWA